MNTFPWITLSLGAGVALYLARSGWFGRGVILGIIIGGIVI
jgi:hypothetical protein